MHGLPVYTYRVKMPAGEVCLSLWWQRRLFPDHRILLLVLKNIAGYKNKMRSCVTSASLTWLHLGHLQPLSGSVSSQTVVAQREACPRNEMAKPPGMKVFVAERHVLRRSFLSLSLSMWCAIVTAFAPNSAFESGPLPR